MRFIKNLRKTDRNHESHLSAIEIENAKIVS